MANQTLKATARSESKSLTVPAGATATPEVELKLGLVSARAIEAVQAHPIVAASGPPRVHELRTVYYDTLSRRLLTQGWFLRLRHEADRRAWSVKSAGGLSGAVAVREEREIESPSGMTDEQAMSWPSLAQLHPILSDGRTRRALRPLFATEFTRKVWLVKAPGKALVELAIDQGAVLAGGAHAPINELELELKNGDVRALYDLAIKLNRDVGLTIVIESKAERALALLGERRPKPRLATPVALTGDLAVGRGLKAMAGSCLEHLLGNQACARLGVDSEGVHQMRVALRRLRAVLALARRAGQSPPGGTVARGLEWLGGILGSARDLDVLIDQSLAEARAAMPDQPALTELAEAMAQRREAMRGSVRAALGARRYTGLMLGIGRWLAEGDDRVMGETTSLIDYAGRALERFAREAAKRGRGIERRDVQALHRLRIALKRLRYAAEFFAPLFESRRTERYLVALRGLQDRLGVINDAESARQCVTECRAGDDSQAAMLARASALLEGWYAARAITMRKKFHRDWRRFARTPRFWR